MKLRSGFGCLLLNDAVSESRHALFLLWDSSGFPTKPGTQVHRRQRRVNVGGRTTVELLMMVDERSKSEKQKPQQVR